MYYFWWDSRSSTHHPLPFDNSAPHMITQGSALKQREISFAAYRSANKQKKTRHDGSFQQRSGWGRCRRDDSWIGCGLIDSFHLICSDSLRKEEAFSLKHPLGTMIVCLQIKLLISVSLDSESKTWCSAVCSQSFSLQCKRRHLIVFKLINCLVGFVGISINCFVI